MIFRFQMLDNAFVLKIKRKPLGNFFVQHFRDAKLIASKRTKDNYLQLCLLLESDFTERVDLNNVANSIQLISLTCKLRRNLSFLI